MNMTATQFNDLRNIANLAYGSGMFEGKSGGNGNLGLMRGPNGEPRVFKCLTHSGERSAFAKNGVGEGQLMQASDELKLELKRLATAAGMSEEDARKLFKNAPERGLLTRKIVAKIVTEISKANGGQDIWAGLKGTGTVKDTTLSLNENTLDLGKYGDKGSKALEEAALAGHNYTLATTGTAAAEQIAAGHIGDEWRESIYAAAAFLGNVQPKCDNRGIDSITMDALVATPEGLPLARPTFVSMTGLDEAAFRPKLFQHELSRLLKRHGDAELTEGDRRAIVRKALTAAVAEAWVLKTMFDVAKTKDKVRKPGDPDLTNLLHDVVYGADDKLRPEVIAYAREGVRKGMEEQAGHTDAFNRTTSLYLRHLYLDANDLDIMDPTSFDPEDDDGKKTRGLAKVGFNNALSFTWSELSADMKKVFAETHEGWEGDASYYSVPTGQGLFKAPGKVYMTEFWMD